MGLARGMMRVNEWVEFQEGLVNSAFDRGFDEAAAVMVGDVNMQMATAMLLFMSKTGTESAMKLFLSGALSGAVLEGAVELAQKLLHAGAGFGTSFDIAARAHQWAVLEILLDTFNKRTAATLCFDVTGDGEAVDASSSIVSTEGLRIPLQEAVEEGKPKVVSSLLAAGAGSNIGESLHRAALSGRTGFARILLGDPLVVAGEAVNALDSAGYTPLHFTQSHVFAALLLSHGADIDAEGGVLGSTPLIMSIKNRRDDVSILLLDGGADVNLANSQGSTALHIAAGGSVYITRSVVEKGASINARDINGRTSLHLAAEKAGSVSSMRLLLEAGAYVNEIDGDLEIPLSVAVEHANTAATRILLNRGGDETFRNQAGLTLSQAIGRRRPSTNDIDRKEIADLLDSAPYERRLRGRTILLRARVRYNKSILPLRMERLRIIASLDGGAGSEPTNAGYMIWAVLQADIALFRVIAEYYQM